MTATFTTRTAEGPLPGAPSHARGRSHPALLQETIGDNFDRTVATYGDRDALVEFATGRRWTYAQLRTEVDALAHGLLRRGIE